ncbi:unnamed protein product [Somion occarium]|uniref:Alpha/beta hydrolase fold-3 domain-containing protein n=1 Tax=Somion occarium TaxID=3059160 RepID=A0ABP1DWA0_9APHY
MPVNTLTSEAGIKIGPILLETLVKHYFERTLKHSSSGGKGLTQLRQDELLYDEAFNIVKAFLEASTKHPVEELQRFSNMRTLSPPWVLVVKVCVPMSCCDEAATFLIKAFGGEEITKRLVGGTKWWQVRGVNGVDAEWIAAKKDWDMAEKRFKAHEKERSGTSDAHRSEGPEEGVHSDASGHYQPEMDEMRCILYAHGGGYYFGSVDQERYSIQRHARKIKGRVFAINYRLAPQYPFPCALQDLLAAYLFLIRPPEGSSHRPVKPAHIVVAGDSAGGGLCLALLQVLRDTGLPLPAGGVLISPWCDLTHSFPSVHLNTATDVIPPYGLSLYKPSPLWPPPPDELVTTVQETVRSRIRHAVGLSTKDREPSLKSPNLSHDSAHSAQRNSYEPSSPRASLHYDVRLPQTGQTLHLGSAAELPAPDSVFRNQSVSCQTEDGKILTIDDQIHLYAPNYLLAHPLISPVVSYLGGLPPLFIIASDKEVLRDEIIYLYVRFQHCYSVEEARAIYPALVGIEERYGPTQVHLQIFDDTAHILPVLFSFTTPAKYCYRAVATFIKFVTGMLPPSIPEADSLDDIPMVHSPLSTPPREASPASTPPIPSVQSEPSLSSEAPRQRSLTMRVLAEDEHRAGRVSLRRAFSARFTKASGSYFQQSKPRQAPNGNRYGSEDVAGPRFLGSTDSEIGREGSRTAGEPSVYANGLQTIIRERVSTRGVIRPLEPESELPAFSLPQELIGVISELAMRRYLDGRVKFDKKFSSTTKSIAKHRRRNLELAKKNAVKNMTQLQTYIEEGKIHQGACERLRGVKEGTLDSWSWAWALDADEHPPPSSIVSRRDTTEAVELARIADQSVLVEEHMLSGNNLWSMIVNFLTVVPDKKHHHHHLHLHRHKHGHNEDGKEKHDDRHSKRERFMSMFAHFSKEQKRASYSNANSPVEEHRQR